MKQVAIMQPTFVPWLGYFELINSVDTFVLLNDIEVSKQSWQTRNLFKTSNGFKWMSVSLKGSSGQRINEIEVSDVKRLCKKLRATCLQVHSKSPYKSLISEFFSDLESFLPHALNLSQFNIFIIKYFCEVFGIKTELLESSELAVCGHRDQLVIDIVNFLDGSKYVSAPGSRKYMEEYGLCNYPFEVEFFDYKKSIPTTIFYDGAGYENVIDAVARLGHWSLKNEIF